MEKYKHSFICKKCKYIDRYIYVCIYIYICIYIRIVGFYVEHLSVKHSFTTGMYVYIYMYIRVSIHIYTYIYMYTYIYIYVLWDFMLNICL
jgi:hypothetical protein